MPQTEEEFEEEFKEEILNVEEFWQFPCCWTAIDGCPIVMKCPPFKNFYSIVLMAMVDWQW